jgi:hypothetical protein
MVFPTSGKSGKGGLGGGSGKGSGSDSDKSGKSSGLSSHGGAGLHPLSQRESAIVHRSVVRRRRSTGQDAGQIGRLGDCLDVF